MASVKKCKICGKEIEGTESEATHNLAVHMMTHKRVKKKGDRVDR